MSAALTALALALLVATGASASQAPASPSPDCLPAAIDGSAQLDGAVTVSPMPGSADAPPQTQISFLGVPAADLAGITVTGSVSGAHAGALQPYSQGDGGSFVLSSPLTAGEQVTVAATATVAGTTRALRYGFTVAVPDDVPVVHAHGHHAVPDGQQAFHSRPDLAPPAVAVHHRSSGEAAGKTLLTPYGVPSRQAGPMMIGRDGKLVWFDPLPRGTVASNLRVQTLDGAPVLTWWQGAITNHGFGLGEDEIVDSRYQPVAVVKAGNGLQADLHEFQITPAGTALLSAYYPIHCDLSSVGGPSDSAVTDSLFQEIDVKTGLVMFQWTSVDHVSLRASYSAIGGSAAWPFDFFHLNSVNLDPDGTLLISSRNTWAAYDIDAATGRLVWTLGGKHPTFTEEPGTTTVFQHDARQVGANAYSLFDNGASPQQHAQSRGVVLTIDPKTRTVTKLTQFLHPGHPLLADSQGNLQALPNGNWLVGWGQEPDVSEFSAAGALLFDASLPAGYESYRALRFPWVGTPETVPALAVARTAGGGADAYVSWNGDTQVVRWELLEGPSADALAHIGSIGRDGFETAIPLMRGSSDRFAAVRALGADGNVLATSAAVALP